LSPDSYLAFSIRVATGKGRRWSNLDEALEVVDFEKDILGLDTSYWGSEPVGKKFNENVCKLLSLLSGTPILVPFSENLMETWGESLS